jgi:purine nucleosidase
MPTPLIIDCDPGVDDAIALLLAFASPELDLIGVTTVHGNVSAALTARNARMIRQIVGREAVPVLAGATRPLLRPPVEAGHFHGESGLGRLSVFEPEAPADDEHAALFLVREIMARPAGSVTLAVVGPMTNVALALRLEPRLAERIGLIVAMGGARSEGGNITASAEFNIYADPHAAQIVLTSGARVVVIGLDATHQVRAGRAQIDVLRTGGPAARASADLLAFALDTEGRLARRHGAPLHDPCTIAYILDPTLFETTPAKIEVECASPLTLGHTAVEMRNAGDSPVRWATGANAEGVFALLIGRLT